MKYRWQAERIKNKLEENDNFIGDLEIEGDRIIGFRVTWTWKEGDNQDGRAHKRKILDEVKEMALNLLDKRGSKHSCGSGLNMFDKAGVSSGTVESTEASFSIL